MPERRTVTGQRRTAGNERDGRRPVRRASRDGRAGKPEGRAEEPEDEASTAGEPEDEATSAEAPDDEDERDPRGPQADLPADEDDAADSDDGGDEDEDTPARRIPAAQAAQAGKRGLLELIGKRAEGVTSVEPTDDGWVVGVEVLEDQRVPSSADLLAMYEVTLDEDGNLMSYRRTRRYSRGRGDGDGGR